MNFKNLFRNFPKEQILALKITGVLFLLFLFLFSLLIYIYHIDWSSKQKNEFANLVLITEKSPRFPERLVEEIKNRPGGFMDYRLQRPMFLGVRDFLIINSDGQLFSRGIFDEIEFDKNIDKLRENEIIQKNFGDKELFIYVLQKGGYKIFLAKDLSSFKSAENRLVLIAGLLSILLLILIYFVSLRLSKLTIEPIEEANKMLSEFNHNVAHELKTPIAILQSNIELSEAIGDFKEFSLSSKEELKNMESIISSLLFLSENRDVKNLEDINLNDFIKIIFEKIKILYKKSKITYEINGDFNIKGNKDLIYLLLKNLIENAFKYSSAKSVISVNINKKYLEIINKGNVIDKSDLIHIFEPFYQIEKSRSNSGFGLGLSIAKKIAISHDWKISFESKNGINKVKIVF